MILSNVALFASLVFSGTQVSLEMPVITPWVLTDHPGHAIFLTSPDALTDKNALISTQIFWEDNTTSQSDYIRLATSFPEQFIRVAGLMNLTLPVNTNISCRTYFDTTFVGSYNNRTTEMPDGSVAIWFLLTNGLSVANRIEFTIYNDIGTIGTGHLPRPVTFDIGEIWLSDAYPYPVP